LVDEQEEEREEEEEGYIHVHLKDSYQVFGKEREQSSFV
jgi:hypothetical protein